MSKLSDLCTFHRVTMTVLHVNVRPGENFVNWAPGARHWRIEFRRPDREYVLVTHFSQGSAHTKPPTLEDVLSCMFSDAEAARYDRFEDWASDLGYDADSRRAERIYNACKGARVQLVNLFGSEIDEFEATAREEV